MTLPVSMPPTPQGSQRPRLPPLGLGERQPSLCCGQLVYVFVCVRVSVCVCVCVCGGGGGDGRH